MKGYEVWDPEQSKIIVSRDVTFEENSTASDSVAVSDAPESPNDVVVHGGEYKREENIDSSEYSNNDVDSEVETGESDDEYQDANEDPPKQLRRSTRVRKPVGEWNKTTSLLTQAISDPILPTSYKSAHFFRKN